MQNTNILSKFWKYAALILLILALAEGFALLSVLSKSSKGELKKNNSKTIDSTPKGEKAESDLADWSEKSSSPCTEADQMWWCNLPDTWKKLIKEKANIPDGVDPQMKDIEKALRITTSLDLTVDKKGFENIRPLTRFTNLRKLAINGMNIRDLTPIANLVRLDSLDISYNNISNISVLSELKNLRHLNMDENYDLTSIKALEGMKKLETLSLNKTSVSDLSPIRNVKNTLVSLSFSNTKVVDLKPIDGFVQLNLLNCSHTQVMVLPFSLVNLKILYCQKTRIQTLSPIMDINLNVINFSESSLSTNAISDYITLHPECSALPYN